MKRSQINRIIDQAIETAKEFAFPLPPFAYYTPEDWRRLQRDEEEIIDNMLGWDVTDFGSGDFEKIGLTIFTFRNGNFTDRARYPKTYAEKMLLVRDGQILPFHFHWSKMEDIINRGGGALRLWLYNADENGQFADTPVVTHIDGKTVTVPAGGEVVLRPGQSITLMPRQYHQWQGVPGTGTVVLFEVSSTNDDRTDNRFYSDTVRLPAFEEDEDARHLVFMDYGNYVRLPRG